MILLFFYVFKYIIWNIIYSFLPSVWAINVCITYIKHSGNCKFTCRCEKILYTLHPISHKNMHFLNNYITKRNWYSVSTFFRFHQFYIHILVYVWACMCVCLALCTCISYDKQQTRHSKFHPQLSCTALVLPGPPPAPLTKTHLFSISPFCKFKNGM